MSIPATASSSSDAFAETTLVWSGWDLNTCFLLHSFFFSDSRGHEMAGTPPWGPLGSESFPALCTSGFLLKLSQWVKLGLSWCVHLSWNTFEAHSYFPTCLPPKWYLPCPQSHHRLIPSSISKQKPMLELCTHISLPNSVPRAGSGWDRCTECLWAWAFLLCLNEVALRLDTVVYVFQISQGSLPLRVLGV